MIILSAADSFIRDPIKRRILYWEITSSVCQFINGKKKAKEGGGTWKIVVTETEKNKFELFDVFLQKKC